MTQPSFDQLKAEIQSSRIIDGKRVATYIKEKAKADMALDGDARAPRLDVILVGDNPASATYVRNKQKACQEVGIDCVIHHYPAEVGESEVGEDIKTLNENPEVDGIFIQLPLPDHLDDHYLVNLIDPHKDVDGFGMHNEALTASANPFDLTTHSPCTPLGICYLLSTLDIPTGSHVVIIGRSDIVGKPLSRMLLNLDYTVTTCHSKTKDLKKFTQHADVIVVAVGKALFLKADMVKPGAIVIDVGINYIEVDGKRKLVGDVDFEQVLPLVSHITPVPGGVGPLTVACLMLNTVWARRRQLAGQAVHQILAK